LLFVVGDSVWIEADHSVVVEECRYHHHHRQGEFEVADILKLLISSVREQVDNPGLSIPSDPFDGRPNRVAIDSSADDA